MGGLGGGEREEVRSMRGEMYKKGGVIRERDEW
jgi:hypothetical protein